MGQCSIFSIYSVDLPNGLLGQRSEASPLEKHFLAEWPSEMESGSSHHLHLQPISLDRAELDNAGLSALDLPHVPHIEAHPYADE
jgi:hypothetical protein